MKCRITALLLALGLTASLSACAPKEQPTPTDAPEPTPGVSAEVTDLPAQSEAPVEPTASESVESAEPQETPSTEPTVAPTQAAIGDPTAPPTTEPTEEPQPTEEPAKDLTAAGLRDMFMLSSSNSNAPTADFSNMADYLENFYNLSKDDLADFVFYMPDMSTALQEFFLAKAKDGKVDAVKAACQSRLDGLREEAEFYPGTADFVDTATVEVVGDWVVLAVCPESSRMAKILQDVVE